MAQIRKIYHIEFVEPIDGERHFYFGSKSALFQRFTAEQVGITYKSFRNIGSIREIPYSNKKCTIRQGELVTSSSDDEQRIVKNQK